MTVTSYEELAEHVGHKITAVLYGGENAAIECSDCSEVLVEFMNGIWDHEFEDSDEE